MKSRAKSSATYSLSPQCAARSSPKHQEPQTASSDSKRSRPRPWTSQRIMRVRVNCFEADRPLHRVGAFQALRGSFSKSDKHGPKLFVPSPSKSIAGRAGLRYLVGFERGRDVAMASERPSASCDPSPGATPPRSSPAVRAGSAKPSARTGRWSVRQASAPRRSGEPALLPLSAHAGRGSNRGSGASS